MIYTEKYKSDFQEIEWNKSSEIIKSSWNTPINLSEALYRKELDEYFRVIEEEAPKLILVDAVKAYYNILPETQEWINERNVVIHQKIGLKKMAFIVSSDIFSQLSFEQALEDISSKGELFKLQYFDDEEKATNWLQNPLD